MRWDGFRRSGNVEDRREQGPTATAIRGGGLGIGTLIVLSLVAWGLGVDPRVLIGGAEVVSKYQGSSSSSADGEARATAERRRRTIKPGILWLLSSVKPKTDGRTSSNLSEKPMCRQSL